MLKYLTLILFSLFLSAAAPQQYASTYHLDLNYEYSNDIAKGRLYTESELIQILHSFPNLQALNISGQILNSTTGTMINGFMPKLEKLIMTGFIRFTHNAQHTISKETLQTIDLNEEFLTSLFQGGLPALKTLVMDYSTLDDKGLSIVADGAPNLQEISLVGVENITDEGLNYFVQKVPEIKTIYLGPVVLMEPKKPHKTIPQQISKEMIQRLQSKGINVVIISRLV